MGTARLFVAFAIEAPWPENLPLARSLNREDRHLTIAFLGNTHREQTLDAFKNLPLPLLSLGLACYFDAPLFLPDDSPNVVSWHVELPHEEEFHQYVNAVHAHLNTPQEKKWLPHVTLGRRPFNKNLWAESFYPIPMVASKICLYESLGNLRYAVLATHDLVPPIEIIEHTADIAFLLRGLTMNDLFHHALVALAFEDPNFCRFRHESQKITTIDDIIFQLGHYLTSLDSKEGSPFKGVSLHGHLKEKHGLLEWEMIVDV